MTIEAVEKTLHLLVTSKRRANKRLKGQVEMVKNHSRQLGDLVESVKNQESTGVKEWIDHLDMLAEEIVTISETLKLQFEESIEEEN